MYLMRHRNHFASVCVYVGRGGGGFGGHCRIMGISGLQQQQKYKQLDHKSWTHAPALPGSYGPNVPSVWCWEDPSFDIVDRYIVVCPVHDTVKRLER